MGMFDINLNSTKKSKSKVEKLAEDTANEEVSEALSLFKSRAKGEEAEKQANVSSEYWFAVYFADEEQRNEFLEKIKAFSLLQDQYINGEALARKLGVEITPKKIKKPKPFRQPKNIGDLIGF